MIWPPSPQETLGFEAKEQVSVKSILLPLLILSLCISLKGHSQMYGFVNLKSKTAIILMEKWVYLGLAEEFQFGTQKLWQTIGMSGDQRRGTLLGGEEEVGRGGFKGKPTGDT